MNFYLNIFRFSSVHLHNVFSDYQIRNTRVFLVIFNLSIYVSTSNHVFGRAIWAKLPSAFLKILKLRE